MSEQQFQTFKTTRFFKTTDNKPEAQPAFFENIEKEILESAAKCAAYFNLYYGSLHVR